MINQSFRREWLRVRARQILAAGAVATLPLLGSQAFAATPAADGLEEVVVTGSSIKGAAPVGSNVIAVGRDQLAEIGAQTVQQVLKTVPAVVGLQSAGQGGFGSFDGAGTNAPTIHGLGASASNSTLVLINGHRLPLTGLNHALADPNILAPAALERVEVLTDGASSV
jgi:iron complex outermembrane receptor protein